MSRRVFLAAAAVAALGLPSTASGATVVLDKPCYVEGTEIVMNASGFTPLQELQVRSTGLLATTTADGAGVRVGKLFAPTNPGFGPRAISSFVLTVAETNNQSISAQMPFQVTNFAFSTSSGAQSPASKRSWNFSGFPEGSTIYGHFIRKGKVHANYRFGKAGESCGTLRKKAPGIPVKKAKSGKWTIQIDTTKKYSKKSTVDGRAALIGKTTVFVTGK